MLGITEETARELIPEFLEHGEINASTQQEAADILQACRDMAATTQHNNTTDNNKDLALVRATTTMTVMSHLHAFKEEALLKHLNCLQALDQVPKDRNIRARYMEQAAVYKLVASGSGISFKALLAMVA